MPTYQYEAMESSSGKEIKDATIDADAEAEAQQMIKEQGYFVTKIQEKDRAKKPKTQANRRRGTHRRTRRFAIG